MGGVKFSPVNVRASIFLRFRIDLLDTISITSLVKTTLLKIEENIGALTQSRGIYK